MSTVSALELFQRTSESPKLPEYCGQGLALEQIQVHQVVSGEAEAGGASHLEKSTVYGEFPSLRIIGLLT